MDEVANYALIRGKIMMALKMDMDLTVYYGLYKKDLEYFKGEYIDLPFIIGMLEDVWGEKKIKKTKWYLKLLMLTIKSTKVLTL